MKKLVSICFLSILFAMFSLASYAQVGCCFRVQDVNADVVHVQNVDQPIALNHTIGGTQSGVTDVYDISLTNCDPSAGFTKLSLEWQLYYNGTLITDDLYRYVDMRFETHYGDLGWLGGNVASGNAVPQDYPGAIIEYEGNINLVNYSLDFFYLHFFANTNTRMQITWKRAGKYELVLAMRERLYGTDFPTLYYNEQQTLNIGGHQSVLGDVLFVDSLTALKYVKDTVSLCATSFPYMTGMPEVAIADEGDYDVVYMTTRECGGIIDTLIDRIVKLHLIKRQNPAAPVAETPVYFCLNEVATALEAETSEGCMLYWSQDSITWSTDPIIPATDVVGVNKYYVYQIDTADISLSCQSPVTTIEVETRALPVAPVIDTEDQNVYYCLNATAVAVKAHASADCTVQWSLTNDFAEFTTTAPVPATTEPGTTVYYARQINNLTGCIGVDYSTVTVVVYSLPEISATVDDDTVCSGKEISLTVTGASGNTYAWTRNPAGWTATGNNVKDNPITGDEVATFIYTVDASYANIGATCHSTFDITVIVNPQPGVPTLTPASTSFTFCGNVDNELVAAEGINATVCNWYNEHRDLILTNDTMRFIGDPEAATVTYPMIVTSYNATTGCESDSVFIDITIYRVPTAEITASETSCPARDIPVSGKIIREGAFDTGNTYRYDWNNCINPEGIDNYIAAGTTCNASVIPLLKVTDLTSNCSTEWVSDTILVQDLEAPVASATRDTVEESGCSNTELPDAKTTFTELQADASVKVVFTDNCGFADALESSDAVMSNTGCRKEVLRTYTISDLCGNTLAYEQLYIYNNNIAPTIATPATPLSVVANTTTNCEYTVPSVEDLVTTELKPSAYCEDAVITISQLPAEGTVIDANDIITVTIEDNCGNAVNYAIPVTLPLKVAISDIMATTNAFCLGDPDTVTCTAENGTTPYIYTWTGDGIIETNDNVIVVNPSTIGLHKYYVTVTDSNNCSTNDSITVEAYKLPTVAITQIANNQCPNIGILPLIATTVAGSGTIDPNGYAWSGESVNIYSHKDTASIYVNPEKCTEEYSVFVALEDSYGCKAKDTMEFNVADFEYPVVPDDITISIDYNNECKLLVPDLTIPVLERSSDNCYPRYLLKFAQNIIAGTEITENTDIEVSVTDCANTTTKTVHLVIPANKLTVAINPQDTGICRTSSINLNAELSYNRGECTYTWSSVDGVIYNTSTSVASVNGSEQPAVGTYKFVVSVEDTIHCVATDTVEIAIYDNPIAILTTEDNTLCDLSYPANGAIILSNPLSGSKYYITNSDTLTYDGSGVIRFDELDADNYIFYSITNHGCKQQSRVSVNSVPAVFNATIASYVDDTNCEPLTPNGEVTIATDPVQADASYKIEGKESQTNSHFTELLGGVTYNFNVTNTLTGCIASVSQYIDHVVPTLDRDDVIASIDSNTVCTVGGPYDGVLTINAVENYEFALVAQGAVEPTVFTTDITFTALAPATYTLYYKNVNNQCVNNIDNVIIPSIKTIPSNNVTFVNITSCIYDNGAISFEQRDNFTYIFNGVASTTQYYYDLLSVGSYTVQVINERGCYSLEETVDIIMDGAYPDLRLRQTPNTVCHDNILGNLPNGIVTVTNPVGSGYTYRIFHDGIEIHYDHPIDTNFFYLWEGLYRVEATDDISGCMSYDTITVLFEANPIDFTVTKTDNGSCIPSLATGSVEMEITNYNPLLDYRYDVKCSSPVYEKHYDNIPDFDTLYGGVYTVSIMNLRDGCPYTDIVTINNIRTGVPAVEFDGDVTSGAICLGESFDLSATATSTPVSTYTYSWTSTPSLTITGASTGAISVSPATAGTYVLSLNVTNDNTGCDTTYDFSLLVRANPAVAIEGNRSPICAGDDNVITAIASACTFKWSTDETTNSINANANETYTVTATDGYGCNSTASEVVVVNALPVITITGNDPLCAGDTTAIVATGGVSYEWSYPGSKISGTTGDFNVVLYDTTDCSVIVIDANGCSNHADFTVTVNPLPAAPTINGLDDITLYYCANEPADGFTYSVVVSENCVAKWFANDNTPLAAQPKAFGSYWAIAENTLTGCIGIDTLKLTISSVTMPTFTASFDGTTTSYCANTHSAQDLTVVTDPAAGYVYTYEWSSVPAGTYPATATISVDPIETTIYSVIVTATTSGYSSCSTTLDAISATVEIYSVPAVPTISSANMDGDTVLYCQGTTAAYTVSAGTDEVVKYSAYTSATPVYVTTQPVTKGKYYVIAENENGCISEPKVFFIDSVKLPVFDFTGISTDDITSLCDGDLFDGSINVTVTVNNSTETTFYWNDVIGTNPLNVSVTVDSTIILTKINAVNTRGTLSCPLDYTPAADNSISITFRELPAKPNILGLVDGKLSYCEGSAFAISPDSIVLASGTHIVWIPAEPTTAGLYKAVSQYNDTPSCTSDTLYFEVVENELPDITIYNDATNSVVDEFFACSGSVVTLIAHGAESYSWSAGIACIETDTNHFVIHATETVINVTGTDVNGCSSTGSVKIKGVEVSVSINITNDTAICPDATINLIATGASNYTETFSYQWDTDPVATVASVWVMPGTYGVVATGSLTGCTAFKDVTINARPVPVPTVAFTDTTLCTNTPITLALSSVTGGVAPYTYSWTSTDTSWTSTDETPLLNQDANSDFVYTIVVTDFFGCNSVPSESSSSIHVISKDDPQFVFMPSRNITSEQGRNSQYSFRILNPCLAPGIKVYLSYEIYRDGVLIPTNEIQSYLVPNGTGSASWTTQYDIDYSNTNLMGNFVERYYKPTGNLPDQVYYGSSNVYKYVYFYTLIDREVKVTTSTWRTDGNYTIKYYLYEVAAGGKDILSIYYSNAHLFGGSDHTMPFTDVRLIASDSINIAVAPTINPLPEPSEVGIETNDNVAASLALYPNPAVEEITLTFNNVIGQTTVKITDINGKVLDQIDFNSNSSTYELKHGVNSYAQGVYFVNVINNDAVITKKFIVVK